MTRISLKLKHHKSDNIERWLVSYADYMTLMFAVFVVLYALAIRKEESFEVLSDSLGQIFDISGAHTKAYSEEGILPKQTTQTELAEANSLQQETGSELVDNNVVINKSLESKLGNPLNELKFELKTALYDIVENGEAELETNDDWLTIELSSEMLFASGSAVSSSSARSVITEIAGILKGVKNLIEVRGYTDNQTINNEIYASNWQLSAARAAEVTNLLERNGIIQERLSIEANGSNNPVASNNTALGRAKNRRVVIALSKLAYNVPVAKEVEKKQLKQQLSDTIPDYKDITVIQLPNGGIRITTRQEVDDTVVTEKNNR